MAGILPVKLNKTKIKTRYFYYFFIHCNNRHTFVKQRDSKDIWQGLFEFPLIETDTKYDLQDMMGLEKWNSLFNNIPIYIMDEKKHFKHQLTHQTIDAEFIHVQLNEISPELANNFLMIPFDDIAKYPVSRLIEKFLHSTDF
jgi:A/G-specific adenine glycosylase